MNERNEEEIIIKERKYKSIKYLKKKNSQKQKKIIIYIIYIIE